MKHELSTFTYQDALHFVYGEVAVPQEKIELNKLESDYILDSMEDHIILSFFEANKKTNLPYEYVCHDLMLSIGIPSADNARSNKKNLESKVEIDKKQLLPIIGIYFAAKDIIKGKKSFINHAGYLCDTFYKIYQTACGVALTIGSYGILK